MISFFMSEHNFAFSLFSVFIAISSCIICTDIALNLIPKLPKRSATMWAILASFTIILGTKTTYMLGIAGLLGISSSLFFSILSDIVSFVLMFITSFFGLLLLLNKNISYVKSSILFTFSCCTTYFTLILSNNMYALSFLNKWFLSGVLVCFIFNLAGSYLFKKELQKRDPSKTGMIGVLFGLSIISLQCISIQGLFRLVPNVGTIRIGDIIAPSILLIVFLFMFIAFIGNWYQQKLQKEQRKLKNQERYYRSLYELNPLAIVMMDETGIILDINQAAEDLAVMDKDKVLGMHFSQFVPEGDQDFTRKQFEKALAGENVEYEIGLFNSTGKLIHVYVRNIMISVDQQVHGIYGMIKDITEEKKNLEKIQFMAYHAPLTNLPNKRKLVEDVATQIRKLIPFSLVYLDLNEFKKTNDRYGHLAGDAVLIEVADRLREADNHGVTYHIGGDEFAVTLPHVEDDMIEKITRGIADVICEPITYQDFILEVFASIGVARFPSDAETIEELLQKADLAMYASKELGESKMVFYDDTLLKKVEERFLLEQDLKEALEKQEFEIYYQPQHEILTGKLRGAEALLRWNHPEKGMLSPSVFIHVLEETGLIVDVGEWVVSQVLESIHSWSQAGYDFQKVSVNISAKHFEKQSLYQFIKDATKRDTALLRHLDIEITESALLNVDKSMDSVRRLKELGVNISLDDFGTGYSSLSVLHQLPIDCLKIDQSFIKDFNEDSKALIRMIIQMSNNLDVKVVAEGIETQEQLDFLIQEGCSYGQGYYFGKPLPKAEFEEKWLKK